MAQITTAMTALATICWLSTALPISSGDKQQKTDLSAENYNDLPLTMAISLRGRFSQGNSWCLSVNSAGQAELTVLTHPIWVRQKFEIPQDKVLKLRSLLRDAKFFESKEQHGRGVPSGSDVRIVITLGHFTKEAVLYPNYGNTPVPDDTKKVYAFLDAIGEFVDHKEAAKLPRIQPN